MKGWESNPYLLLHVLQAPKDKVVDDVVGQEEEATAGHVQDSL